MCVPYFKIKDVTHASCWLAYYHLTIAFDFMYPTWYTGNKLIDRKLNICFSAEKFSSNIMMPTIRVQYVKCVCYAAYYSVDKSVPCVGGGGGGGGTGARFASWGRGALST